MRVNVFLDKVNPQCAVSSDVRRASLGAFAPRVALLRGWLCLGEALATV